VYILRVTNEQLLHIRESCWSVGRYPPIPKRITAQSCCPDPHSNSTAQPFGTTQGFQHSEEREAITCTRTLSKVSYWDCVTTRQWHISLCHNHKVNIFYSGIRTPIGGLIEHMECVYHVVPIYFFLFLYERKEHTTGLLRRIYVYINSEGFMAEVVQTGLLGSDIAVFHTDTKFSKQEVATFGRV
jgi:hypothetical protein